MSERSLKVRIVRESAHKVTIYMLALNRAMPVPRKEFEKRVANGLYTVVNPTEEEE